MTLPVPFKINTPQAVLDDLRSRLAATRWPDEVAGAGWDYGANLAYLRELADYWLNQFDWRKQEAALNAFAHYRMDVDGLGIHFIHERGRGPNPTPLILTHGWPSSFFELTKLIPLLTDPGAHGGDPAQSFDVVVPSLPGYGFSDASHTPGMLSSRVAELWATLMPRLGYARFAAFGSDIGAGVTSRLGLYHPERLLGIYVLSVLEPYLGPGTPPLSAAEQAFQALGEAWDRDEGAYSHIQATRPQTLAYGLNDSPIGLAAWIVEKWRAWGDTHGDCHGVTNAKLLGDLRSHVFLIFLLTLLPSHPRSRTDFSLYVFKRSQTQVCSTQSVFVQAIPDSRPCHSLLQ